MAKKKQQQLTITLVKSPIGCPQRQKKTIRALGLRRMHDSVLHEDTPVIRGMIERIGHLVQVEEK
jgi:large subunit ribosomal protein L30